MIIARCGAYPLPCRRLLDLLEGGGAEVPTHSARHRLRRQPAVGQANLHGGGKYDETRSQSDARALTREAVLPPVGRGILSWAASVSSASRKAGDSTAR